MRLRHKTSPVLRVTPIIKSIRKPLIGLVVLKTNQNYIESVLSFYLSISTAPRAVRSTTATATEQSYLTTFVIDGNHGEIQSYFTCVFLLFDVSTLIQGGDCQADNTEKIRYYCQTITCLFSQYLSKKPLNE